MSGLKTTDMDVCDLGRKTVSHLKTNQLATHSITLVQKCMDMSEC